MPQASELAYDILIGNDIKDVVQRIVREIGYPQATPPEDYFRQPIFTTWVEYKTEVSQLKVLEFAHAIREAKIPAGFIEIDDKWESRYGDMQFDSGKFPDPKAMVDELHGMGFKVTLWVHPFVNVDSESYAQLRHSGDLIGDRTGDAGLIRWWQGIGAVWDFTNPAAATAYRARLAELQSKYGFDGFKFDGGDVNLVPRDLKDAQRHYRCAIRGRLQPRGGSALSLERGACRRVLAAAGNRAAADRQAIDLGPRKWTGGDYSRGAERFHARLSVRDAGHGGRQSVQWRPTKSTKS